MSSHYSLNVVSSKEIGMIALQLAIKEAIKEFDERLILSSNLSIQSLTEVSSSMVIGKPKLVKIGYSLFERADDDRAIRYLNLMTNYHDDEISIDDDRLKYKENLSSVQILTTTRLKNDNLDVIKLYKRISEKLEEILPNQDLVSMYRDETNDVDNYVLINGDIKNIFTEE